MIRSRFAWTFLFGGAACVVGCDGDSQVIAPPKDRNRVEHLHRTMSDLSSWDQRKVAHNAYLQAASGVMHGKRGDWCKLVVVHCNDGDCLFAWPKLMEYPVQAIEADKPERAHRVFSHQVKMFGDYFPARCHDSIAASFGLFSEYHATVVGPDMGGLWVIGDQLVESCAAGLVSPLEYRYSNIRYADPKLYVHYLQAINPNHCITRRTSIFGSCSELLANNPNWRHPYLSTWLRAHNGPGIQLSPDFILARL